MSSDYDRLFGRIHQLSEAEGLKREDIDPTTFDDVARMLLRDEYTHAIISAIEDAGYEEEAQEVLDIVNSALDDGYEPEPESQDLGTPDNPLTYDAYKDWVELQKEFQEVLPGHKLRYWYEGKIKGWMYLDGEAVIDPHLPDEKFTVLQDLGRKYNFELKDFHTHHSKDHDFSRMRYSWTSEKRKNKGDKQ